MTKGSYQFFGLVVASLILTFAINKTILTDDVYQYSLSDTLSSDRIDEFLKLKNSWGWISYTFIPVFCFLRVSLTSICLASGVFVTDDKASISSLFNVAVIAEFVKLLPSLILLIWFNFIQTSYTLNDIQAFKPLSLFSFFAASEFEPWTQYILSHLNIFLVFYVGVLAFGLSKIVAKNYWQSFKMTLLSYGSGFIIWILIITFLLVSIS